MKVSLNWLSDYVDCSRLSAEELGEVFMRLGFPVEDIEETDADIVLDLEVTSNRPDLLGHLGVARELAAAAGLAFTPPQIPDLPAAGRVTDLAAVDVREPTLCPRYTARVIRGVKVGRSPAWLVEYLQAVGLRSVNNVVDVTNFVLMEYAQPLHSFDLAGLDGGQVLVRRAEPGETLVSIDESRCELNPEMLVIADATKPVAVAGVMGGLNTEVTEATTDLLIEAAQFDPLTTRRTSRALGLMSESNYRFERGIDPVAVDEASLRACQLILDLAGGELAEGVIDVWAQPFQPSEVTLRVDRCNRLLGFDTPAERQVEILAKLGLSPQLADGVIRCTPPSYRADLTREADLIEEVGRIEGYDRIPVHDKITQQVAAPGLVEQTRKKLAEALAAAGFDEVVTAAYLDQPTTALFGCDEPVCVDPLHRRTHNALRPTLLPSLLTVVKTNQDAGNAGVNLYELAAVFPPAEACNLPAEHVQLALASEGDLRDLRGAIEAAVGHLAPKAELHFRPAPSAGFDPPAALEITLDGEPVGSAGLIDAKVADHFDLTATVAAGQIRFAPLVEAAKTPRAYEPIARFPGIQRDLSFIVDDGVRWADLAEVIDALPQAYREDLDYVTTFRGKPIAKGRKSLTLRLTYRAADRTLRNEDVDELIAAVVAAAKDKLNAELR